MRSTQSSEMATTSANLITQERTERVSRLLEPYPTLTITLRQDTASRGSIESIYSSSGLNGALRSLNPLAATKSFHCVGYVRPDPEAARPPPLRALIASGQDSVLNHNSQCDIDSSMRAFIREACPLWADDVLPADLERIAPASLAARISLAAAGIKPTNLELSHPSPTTSVIAFTSRVLGVFADVDTSSISYSTVPAKGLIASPDMLGSIITNYGYETRGQMRRDAPTCISPNDLPESYDIAWLSAIVVLIAYQTEIDLSAFALNPTDRTSMASHTASIEVLMRRFQWLSPFSSKLMHLCVAHATNPFRSFEEMILMWQKPSKFTMPLISIKMSGSALEVIANEAQLFRIGAVMVGGT
ncbi:NS protein [Atlantic halibut reovirus]|nr:NS protein [Atlantic halibut reovirus]